MKRLLISISLVGFACLAPLQGQDYSKFAFNMGGGITTPLNPTGAYAGISSNFVVGSGYNINKSNAIIGEFLVERSPFEPLGHPAGKSADQCLEERAHPDHDDPGHLRYPLQLERGRGPQAGGKWRSIVGRQERGAAGPRPRLGFGPEEIPRTLSVAGMPVVRVATSGFERGRAGWGPAPHTPQPGRRSRTPHSAPPQN